MKQLHQPFNLGSDARGNPRYSVTHHVAEGGMGIVFRGVDLNVQKEVAIKAIKVDPDSVTDPVLFDRFKREARTVAKLQHPHIIPVSDFFEGQMAHQGKKLSTMFYVMPLLEGVVPLNGVLRGGPLSYENVLTLVQQQGSALEYIHSKGIVHRDIKPDQILTQIDASGTLKHTVLADFGLVKLLDKDVESLTLSGEIVGTPYYMPPEQVDRSKGVNEKVDIYSMGATYFNALTGGNFHLDFSGATGPMECFTMLMGYGRGEKIQAIPLRKFRPDAPKKLEEALLHATHRDPAQRPSAAEMKEEMTEGLELAIDAGRGTKQRRRSTPPAPQAGLDTVDEPAPQRRSSGRHNAIESPTLGRQARAMREAEETDMTRRKLLYILGGSAALAAVAAVTTVVYSGKPQTPPAPQAPTNPPRIDTTRNPPTNPTTQTQTQQPRVEVVESGLKLTIRGNYDQASTHRFVESNGRFTAEHNGAQLANPRDPAHVEQKLVPGRYQARIIYGDNKTMVVPLQVAQGRTLERVITVPEFNPNDVRVGGHAITREPWVFVSAAQGNQDKSFWYLPQWTQADQAIFLQRMYLDNIPAGQRPSNAAGWEILRRMPCMQDTQRPRPFYAVKRQDEAYIIAPDPREVPNIGLQDMSTLPLTSVTLGISQDAINGREFRNANLIGLLQGQIPAGYGIDLPSQDELALAFTGGPLNSPFLRFGDNDTALPPEWSMYDQTIRSRGIQELRALGHTRQSPVGVPIFDGGATRFYTNESRVVSGTQYAKVGAMGAEGFVIQDVNADERDPTLGVAYVIRKAN